MRLSLLMFAVILAAAPAAAQPTAPSTSPAADVSPAQDFNLPVSLDRIRGRLERSSASTLRGLEEVPNFRIEVQEKQRLEDLLAATFKDVKKVPVPAEGVYMQEMQRQWWPLVDNPLMQPYAAFNQPELAAVAVEGIAVGLLIDPIMHGLSALERAAAEHAARVEVRDAIAQYCAARPDRGAGIQICGPPM